MFWYIPMDYDDDDVLHHNLQLAGESRNKSSVLKPYDFPKFDFDDSLQGHLRFDSLVETEVFLGIQSQEDCHWIDDYSRGSNGMEFNSNPADSCSISRHDNVWSEATCSESVEMLLKSVGQEEMMPASSDQDASGRHVESGAELGARNLDTNISKDEDLKDHPSSNCHMEDQLPQVVYPLPNPETIESSCEISRDLAQIALKASSDMAVESKNAHHREPACEDSKKLETFDEKSKSCGYEGDSSHDSSKNVSNYLAMLGNSEAPQLINGEQSGDVNSVAASSASSMVEDELKLSEADEKIKSLTIKVMTGDGEGKVSHEVKDSSGGCPGGSSVDGSIQHSAEQCASPEQKADSPVHLLPIELREIGLFVSHEVKDSLGGCLGGSSVDGSIHHSAEQCDSPEEKADSPVRLLPKELRTIEDVPTSQSQSIASSEKPPLTVKDNKFPMGKGECIKNTGDRELLSFNAENNQSENAEGCQNESVVVEEVCSAQLPGCAEGNCGQMISGNLGQMKAGSLVSTQDSVETNERGGLLPVDTGNMDSGSENVVLLSTSLETQSVGDEGVKGDTSHHKLQTQTSGKREAATELAPLLEIDAMAAPVSCSDFGERRSIAVGLSNPDCNYDKDHETRLSDVRPIAGVSSVSGLEACVAVDFAQDHLSRDFVKSQQFVENFNEMSSKRSPSLEATTSLHLDDPTVNLGSEKCTLKSSDTEVVTKNDADQESPHVAEVDKAFCCSPTIISSSKPSQLEKDDQEEPRISEVTNKFVQGSQLTSEDVKVKDIVGDDNSFTFKVNALPETSREPGKSWSPIRDTEKCNSPVVVKESLPSWQGKAERMPFPKSPRKNTRMTDVEAVHGTPKGTPERKGRRGSGKAAARESGKKGSQSKGANQETSAGKQDKASDILFSAPSSSPHVQFGHIQSYKNTDGSTTKLSGVGVLPSASFVDSNALALSKSTSPPSPGLQQPFTDLQQVQLRAQIFVYGSLIQGVAPDEACMVSAFGPSDVGRSCWEPIWQVAVERVRSQKCSPNASETPLHSESGLKQSSHSSKGLAASVSKVGKDAPAMIASPIPLSSSLWSVSTSSRDSLPSSALHKGAVVDFQQPVTPLHSYQTPPIRSFIGHSSWPSQTCFPNPWVASAQTPAFNSTVCFQPVSMTETVKLTPVKDTSLPSTSAIKPVTSVGSSAVYGGVSSLHDSKATSSSDLHSGDPKPRKRKKGPATEPHHSIAVSVAQTAPLVIQSGGPLQTSAVDAPAAIAPAQGTVIGKSAADGSTVCSTDPPEKSNFDTGKTGACSKETLKYVAEAKTQAEEAAGHATAAVSHSEELWGKLTKQKESGLTSEVEAKLVSAVAAIAAAASVAKAAAAAAKIACNAALQAKLLADEALYPSRLCSEVPSGNSITDVHDVGNATPASILKGDKASNESSSILVAAKEAAKRRVDAASAASKQAENLDAVLKAAELAAAAVSQAGKIVAMGEPLLLKDLFEAGPEGYWKLPQSPSELAKSLRKSNREQSGAVRFEESADVPGTAAGEYPSEREGSRKTGHVKIHRSEKLKDSVDGQLRLADSVTVHGESSPGRNGVKSPGVDFEPDQTQGTSYVQNEHNELAGTLPDDGIKKGSVVEVYKCGGDLKSAWYLANVLRLQDGKAYVSYCDLSLDEGSGNLCEWVCLGSEGEKAPVVRVAHPTTSVSLEKTRKRCRAAFDDYAWCVGDKVDVWIDDCWWEGVVTERNEKDETTLKVHFPVQGESLTVRAWNLRTSRSWINGKWVEWSSLRAHCSLDKSDTPQEKRLKLETPAIATKGKDQSSKDLDVAVAKTGESKLSSLSTSERTFHIGKTLKEDKYTARRPLRSGQQKEGSRVIFGVPKPTGKKRKFMDVSKHYPTNEGDKGAEAAVLDKSSKYVLPQGAGSRGWKPPSRNESRDKRTVEAKPRIPGTRKSQRTVPRRDNVVSTPGLDSDNGIGRVTDAEDHVGGDDSSEKMDQGFIDVAAEAPLSSLLPHSLNGTSKRTISSNSKPERLTRGKLAPAGSKLSNVEEDKVYTANSGKVGPEVAEPRRSNRRVQPTHRFLESLQSSMIIPKMPSISHEKVSRNQSRSVLTKGK